MAVAAQAVEAKANLLYGGEIIARACNIFYPERIERGKYPREAGGVVGLSMM